MEIQQIQQKIKNKTILYITIVIALFSIINVIYVYYEQKISVQNTLQSNIKLTNEYFYSKVNNDLKILESFRDNVIADKQVIKLFDERNREALYQESLKYFDWLKILDQHINNMHFYLPDSTSFLRMHKPESYGDDLSNIRPIVDVTNESLTKQKGFEAGKFGFYLRVTAPLFYKDSHIGSIGIGLNIMATLEDLKNLNNNIYLISMPKKEISSKNVQSFYNMEDQSVYEGKKCLILSSVKQNLYRFAPLLHLSEKLNHEIIKIKNQHYLVNYSMKIKNFQNRDIARIISIQNVTNIYEKFHNDLMRIILLSIFSFIMIFIGVNVAFRSYNTQINTLYKKYLDSVLKLETMSLKLNPHFLFNSLNVISELMYKNVKSADDNIFRLSKLLRSYLDSSSQISLAQEIEFTEDYCYLQNTRYNGQHTIIFEVEDKTVLDREIPKFSVQLLVENAFKHGILDRIPMIVKIKIYHRDDQIIISVSNTGKMIKNLTKGYGLKNLEHRLHKYCNGSYLTHWSRLGVTSFTIHLKECHELSDY